jgi:hypothetical protein
MLPILQVEGSGRLLAPHRPAEPTGSVRLAAVLDELSPQLRDVDDEIRQRVVELCGRLAGSWCGLLVHDTA